MKCLYCGDTIYEFLRTFSGNYRSQEFDYPVIEMKTYSSLTIPNKGCYIEKTIFKKAPDYNPFYRNKNGFQCFSCDKFYSINLPTRYNSIILNKKISTRFLRKLIK